MLINKGVSIYTNKVALVPYCSHHVKRYHEWMRDRDIQVATASEALSLDDEYAMQRSWRTDGDKLTFISCRPWEAPEGPRSHEQELRSMIGDTNLFVSVNEEESGDVAVVGELELMIAEKQNQRTGYGRAAVLVFLLYIFRHETEVLHEYFSSPRDVDQTAHFDYLRVKINESNGRSISLFESLGFKKTETAPNFFGEYELRTKALNMDRVQDMLRERGIDGYCERSYEFADAEEDTVLQKQESDKTTASESSSFVHRSKDA